MKLIKVKCKDDADFVKTFDKMFGRGSKYYNEYDGHYASYASGVSSAWDYFSGEVVFTIDKKGQMELETADGDYFKFKPGDFDGAKRKLEKILKEY